MQIILNHDLDTNHVAVEIDLAGARSSQALALVSVGALAVIHEVAEDEEHEELMAMALAQSILTKSVTVADDGEDLSND